MKTGKLGSPAGVLITAALLAAPAGAIYVTTSAHSDPMTPVTPVDLGDPQVAQDALRSDPFDVGVRGAVEADAA